MPTQPASEEVAFWELDLENEGQPVPVSHSVQPCIRTSGIVDIGIFEDQEDVRIPVNEADVKPGGKYHGSNASLPPQLPSLPSKPPKADRLKKSYNAAIVKLFSRFGASETWTTATGWLLKDDIVVTAAHCVYNNSQRATSVKVCIGYNAKGSKDANVSAACEQRFVNRIALPLEWITAETEPHDMAFLQLKSPFQNVTPIVCDTPEINAWRQLTVIGYPTDLGTSGEPGGEMCEMKIDRDINLKRTRWNMLAYQGDLQGGKNSLLLLNIFIIYIYEEKIRAEDCPIFYLLFFLKLLLLLFRTLRSSCYTRQ